MKSRMAVKAGRVLLRREVAGLTPEQVFLELERIKADNNNRLNAAAVVKASKDSKAMLHGVFTWDNKKAAHKWRLQEADNIIQAVVVKADSGEEKPVYKVKVIDKDDAESNIYIKPVNDDFIAEQVKHTLVSLWQRHKTIKKYKGVWESIEAQFNLI